MPASSPSPRHRLRRVLVAGVAACSVMSVAACGSSDDGPGDVATVTPAAPSVASAITAAPAGFVVPVSPNPRALAVSDGTVAVLTSNGLEVTRFERPRSATETGAQAAVAVPELTELIGTGDGGFLGAGPDHLVRIGADGTVRVTETPMGSVTALAQTSEGDVVVGNDAGRLYTFDNELTRLREFGGFVRVDSITASPEGADPADQVVVLDRAQSSVTPVNLGDGSKGPALRAGNGATTSTIDHFGRILVANTRDDEIVGFYGSPLVMRFRYPVPGGPYAVDYDDERNLLWVSTTADNEVVGFDLSDGEPSEKSRFAAVAQPDSLAVDDSTGTIYVLSARDGGLQVVSPESR